MTFDEIFREYYSLYRGQASTIPVYGDREYTTAIQLGNAAIKKWERADGILWKDLYTTLAENAEVGLIKTITGGTTTYAAPADLRKPPGFVNINGTPFTVIPTQDVSAYTNESSRVVWFTGSAQQGYTMHVPAGTTTQTDGFTFDYPYYKKATLLTVTPTPAAIVPEMSDPTFMIQDMLATRAQQARNGFVFKAAKAESTLSLANMKIENDSGTYHNTQNMRDTGFGWGVPRYNGNADIRL
jgi:hypothetical protein